MVYENLPPGYRMTELSPLPAEWRVVPHSAPPSLQQVISPGPQEAHRGLVMGRQVEDQPLAPPAPPGGPR